MKHAWMGAAAALLVAGWMTSGCDWQAGSSSETVSDRYNFANFSGVYRAANNGLLISDYTSYPEAGSAGSTNTVTGEVIGSTSAGDSVYSGVLAHANVLDNSVQIQAGVFVLNDDGDGALAGNGKTGTIVYQTGAWSINLAGEWPADGTPITASYRYAVNGSSGSTAGINADNPGVSGAAIYSFNITQSGNTITIVDNNGATYSGKISTIRSTGGVSSDQASATSPQPADGDTIIASFEASGTSAAGVKVKIVGSLNGLVDYATTGGGTGGSTTSASLPRLTTRTLGGTWIESNGVTGTINGTAN